MAEGMHSVSMWGHAISPCTRGSKGSAEQERLWALSRGEGEDRDRSWGHASPRVCVPQFLKNKPCCWMKCNQVPQQTVPRAYKASNSCLPPAVTCLVHRAFIIIIIIRPAPSAVGMAGTDPSISHPPCPDNKLQAAAKPSLVQPLLLGCQHKRIEAPQGLSSLFC